MIYSILWVARKNTPLNTSNKNALLSLCPGCTVTQEKLNAAPLGRGSGAGREVHCLSPETSEDRRLSGRCGFWTRSQGPAGLASPAPGWGLLGAPS